MKVRIQSTDGSKQPKLLENIHSVVVRNDNDIPVAVIMQVAGGGIWMVDSTSPDFASILQSFSIDIRQPEVTTIEAV